MKKVNDIMHGGALEEVEKAGRCWGIERSRRFYFRYASPSARSLYEGVEDEAGHATRARAGNIVAITQSGSNEAERTLAQAFAHTRIYGHFSPYSVFSAYNIFPAYSVRITHQAASFALDHELAQKEQALKYHQTPAYLSTK
ncbi:unnamed protein product [Cyclocybe aegerita]|uniref:Uncharacterized protein n=1 Tax=Cyclocybe aegerita TaxID=1973307 RepID=A0A8S0XKK5_CYCAE|nr:unnamed protein product [Cyclocybe aegerita]